jgi:hypothetical protein
MGIDFLCLYTVDGGRGCEDVRMQLSSSDEEVHVRRRKVDMDANAEAAAVGGVRWDVHSAGGIRDFRGPLWGRYAFRERIGVAWRGIHGGRKYKVAYAGVRAAADAAGVFEEVCEIIRECFRFCFLCLC